MKYTQYEFFKIEKNGKVASVILDRADAGNAQSWSFWVEMPRVMEDLAADHEVSVILIRADGQDFSLGLDLKQVMSKFGNVTKGGTKSAEQRHAFRTTILKMQRAITSVAQIEKPVVAAIQGKCIGGGLDLISACDIRLASTEAVFSLREARVAIVADMGSLQRLPGIIGEGNTRRLAFTGEDIDAMRAKEIHLVDDVYNGHDELLRESHRLCQKIAKNSALVLSGIKSVMNFNYERNLANSLENVINWNCAFIESSEFTKLTERIAGRMENGSAVKEKPAPQGLLPANAHNGL